MDGSNPGEIGVIAWCNSFRFQLAKDPGRQFMHDQIKNKGFDFLDTYLEDTLARPTEGRIYDIMKTPGRKRDAPKRTRAATAAASKVKTVIADSLSERKEKENVAPVNDFHKALLDAKSTNDELVEDAPVAKPKQKKPSPPAPQQDEMDDRESAPTPRPVPVVKDAPVKPKSPSPAHEDMEIEEPEPAPIELAQPEPAVAATIPTIITPEIPVHSQSQDTLQELSMIVEENDERSRLSLQQPVDEYNSDSDADMETEMMVPIKDEDATTTTILNRKPSISQFGLPAPSPLKKSTRGPREPSVPPPPSQTPGTAMNNKRTSG
ncbi:hypothetical protein QCA50_001866 [Cerrena zonata]|uniref:Uncharacterized protein n=1 Tax=Cerrena zonata TaxID=2478898 RepID=A0AAW0GM65_9APHY